MKRIACLLLLLCLLLTACAPGENTATTAAPSTLMDRARQTEQKNLKSISLPALEGLENPGILLFGSDFLVYATDGATLTCRLVSAGTGAVIVEAAIPASADATVQATGDRLSICDSHAGTVRFLDRELAVVATHSPIEAGGLWCLSTDGTTLFCLRDTALTATDLQTGVTEALLQSVAGLTLHGQGEAWLTVAYEAAGITMYSCLNLRDKAFYRLPMPTMTEVVSQSKDFWLFAGEGEYHLLTGSGHRVVPCPEGSVRFLTQKQHLLVVVNDTLKLHDLQGHLLSSCRLPEGSGPVADIFWSYLWNGYFLLTQSDGGAKLLFWTISGRASGEVLEITDLGSINDGSAEANALAARADALSEQYGITISMGGDCATEYGGFLCKRLTDLQTLSYNLDRVEATLEAYPEGFIAQLAPLKVDIVCDIAPKDTEEYAGVYSGFSYRDEAGFQIVLDGYVNDPVVLHHELAHAIDRVLAEDAALRPDALFSEGAWLALQPEGFAYESSYGQMSGQTLAFENSGYFVRRYGMTHPTEDRATMMEAVMGGDLEVFEQNPMLYPKLDYYARCIRDCFDDSLWPAKTPWESLLPEAPPEPTEGET